MSDYNIWVVEYAQLPDYPDSALIYGVTEGKRLLPFYYFVLQRGDNVTLVDCGWKEGEYADSMIEMHGIVGYSNPGKILARIGLAPEDVKDIILTHHHFDHAGGLDYFPNARVWIQQREIDNWMAKWTTPPRLKWLAYGLDPETGAALARVGGDGRLRALHGRSQVQPGVEVRPCFDTHTAGSQYVVISNGDDAAPWVLPGDTACVYENIGGPEGKDMMIPVGLAQGSQECCVRSTDEMLTVAHDDITKVLPMHEERLFDRFPAKRYDDGLRVCEIELSSGTPSRVAG
jgi:N-acyl homoserine lactone hydrolase